MKRYYLDRLNVGQSIIKALIVNVLLTLFLALILFASAYEFYIWYLYILGLVYIAVFIVHISKSFIRLSFYINDNSIIYCKGRNEKKIKLHNIIKLEEYFGINYLFGKKTIIIYVRNKRYSFVLNKERADIFRDQLEEYINIKEEFGDFNL